MSLVIQVSELYFTTEDGIKVLEDVHLRVERGELVFLVGPAAAGKSLLLRLLAAQIPPQSGQILVLGRNIARLSREKASELRRRIGFVPQGFSPLPGRTVLENAVFRLRARGDFREQAEEKGLAALDRVGLVPKVSAPAADLEPSDKVRLGLALAICDEPLLLLYDEPFAELDEKERQELYSLFARIHSAGLTTLVATRGPLPDPAPRHRVVLLTDGRVRAP
jgi:ABC-type ATPase involved in cell division